MFIRDRRILEVCGILSEYFQLADLFLLVIGSNRRADLFDEEFRRVARSIDKEYKRLVLCLLHNVSVFSEIKV